MKHTQSTANINQLLQPLSETAQQTVSGGASDYLLEIDGIKGETISGGGTLIPIKIKHNV